MDVPVLAEVCVALSANSSGSILKMWLSSGFDAGSKLKILGCISRSGLNQWYCSLWLWLVGGWLFLGSWSILPALDQAVHLSWDSFFIVWDDANGKFTYLPIKYKPEISKLDYTNLSLCQIPSRSRYIQPRFELMELTVLSVDLFSQRYELTIIFCQNFAWKLTKLLTLHTY